MSGSISVLIFSFFLSQDGIVQCYEWSCSSLDASNGHYTIPGLRGYGGDVNSALTFGQLLPRELDDHASIFPVGSTLNCSGTVSALEFCYSYENSSAVFGTNYTVFTLLILQQIGLTFNVRFSIDVNSKPTAEKCIDQELVGRTLRICCDSMQFDVADQFNISERNFAFGIIPTEFRQLRYRDDSLQVEQYNFIASDIQARSSFTLETSLRNDMPPRLLHFIITDTTTTEPVTTHPATDKLTEPSTDQATSYHQPITTTTEPEPATKRPATDSPTKPSTNQATSHHQPITITTMCDNVDQDDCSTTPTTMTPPDTSDLTVAGISGGVGAAVLVLILLIILALCVPLVLYKRPRHSKQAKGHDTHINSVITAQPNQAYGTTKAKSEEVFYETIEIAGNGKNKDQFETEDNCAYGVNSDVAVVVASNSAYGVHVKDEDEEPYYY